MGQHRGGFQEAAAVGKLVQRRSVSSQILCNVAIHRTCVSVEEVSNVLDVGSWQFFDCISRVRVSGVGCMEALLGGMQRSVCR